MKREPMKMAQDSGYTKYAGYRPYASYVPYPVAAEEAAAKMDMGKSSVQTHIPNGANN